MYIYKVVCEMEGCLCLYVSACLLCGSNLCFLRKGDRSYITLYMEYCVKWKGNFVCGRAFIWFCKESFFNQQSLN